jgi:large subunit ribosomal protein L21
LREAQRISGNALKARDLWKDVKMCLVPDTFSGGRKGRFFIVGISEYNPKWADGTKGFIMEKKAIYAIFQSGGKQYKAAPGKVIKLEKISGEVGDKVNLNQVLLFHDGNQTQIGQPLLDDVQIRGRIVEQGRHRKVIVFKFKRRKDYRKKQGHRQYYTAVLVEGIDKKTGGVQIEKGIEEVQEAAEQ